MARMAIAVVAILVVVFSAGFTAPRLTSAAQSSGRAAQQARSAVSSANSQGLLLSGIVQPGGTPPSAGTSEEGPPLVLLAYLGLVIVGSALAIGSVRANGGRDL